MADRTGCVLNISGLLSSEHAGHVAQALHVARPYDLTGRLMPQEIEQRLIEDKTFEWDFDEVDKGQMLPLLKTTLTALRLGWSWSWNWGENFCAGITFYDPVTDQSDTFLEADREICLTVSELSNPARIEAAKKWAIFQAGMSLHIYESNHHLTDMLKQTPAIEPYVALIGQIDTNTLP